MHSKKNRSIYTKEFLMIIVFGVFFLPNIIDAQIILQTECVGSTGQTYIYKYYSKWDPPRTTCQWYRVTINDILLPDQIMNSHHFSSYSFWYGTLTEVYVDVFKDVRAVLEINIDSTVNGDPFPHPRMQTYNWKAYLKGLYVTQVEETGRAISLGLFDLKDTGEDGVITLTDTEREGTAQMPALGILPRANSMLDPIDITEALRRDLFLSRPNITSGFVFSSLAPVVCSLEINPQMPYVEIVFNKTHCNDIKLDLNLFQFGSNMKLSLYPNHKCIEAPDQFRCVLLLELFGDYYFYPSWSSGFDSFNHDKFGNPILDFPVLDELLPAGQLTFFAAVINPQTQSIISEIAETTYVWP